ncbi:MAG: hypothetical protein SFW35_05725 [Chitinophagales bacterium]|nr:hypothetical protein [Chitinophagales bacterium]
MQDEEKRQEEDLPGYPHYPASEDIYSQEDKTMNIDADNDAGILETGEIVPENANEETSIAGLDVPGAELDDDSEAIGAEDEENNYYSLGGDNHEELEERRSDSAVEGGLND